MAQSLAKLYIHIVFSTKNREPWITHQIQSELFAYMAAILKSNQSPAIIIGGMPDHIHILCRQSKNIAPCKLIELVKKNSSRWIKTKGKEFHQFLWQNGYGAFSVSQSHINMVRRYIANQAYYHQRIDFKKELITLLEKYEVDFDERYLWN